MRAEPEKGGGGENSEQKEQKTATEFQRYMAYLQRSEQLEQAQVKPEWDGVESSLRFMKQAFSKVFDSLK